MGSSTYTPKLHRVKIHNNSSVIATATATQVPLNGTTDYNVGSLSTAGNQITIKSDGVYHVIAHALFGSPNPNTSGTYRIAFITAGGSVVADAIEGSGVSDFSAHSTAHWIGELVAGDTVFMTVQHNAGGSLTLSVETCLTLQMLRRL